MSERAVQENQAVQEKQEENAEGREPEPATGAEAGHESGAGAGVGTGGGIGDQNGDRTGDGIDRATGDGIGDQTGDEWDEAVHRFVERFAAELTEAGMPRMPSRVFAALLASPEGVLTSAGIGRAIRISPAAVSGAIRYLSQVNMVSREREPGSRRDRYRVHSSLWYEALTNRDATLRRWEDTLREGIVAVGPDSDPGRRMAETLEFFAFLQQELAGMMQRWREHRDKVLGM